MRHRIAGGALSRKKQLNKTPLSFNTRGEATSIGRMTSCTGMGGFLTAGGKRKEFHELHKCAALLFCGEANDHIFVSREEKVVGGLGRWI